MKNKRIIGDGSLVKIGIMSDSHDNISAIKRAVELFNEQKVVKVFHAGDFVAPFIVPLGLKELKCEVHGVFGNNDGERFGLKATFDKSGLKLEGDFYRTTIDNRRIIMFHTLDDEMIEALASRFDVIIRGHTHQAEIRKIGDCLLVNPGETCGILSGKNTVAVLDLEKMEAKIVSI